jgi:hypothetical protein
MIPIAGWAPDADPTSPGILTEVSNSIPNERGYIGAPTGVAPSGVGVLAAECRGAAVVTRLSGARRIFAGTQTRMYEFIAGSWVDVSAAGNYTGSTENRWSFAQFGDFTLTSNDTEPIGASSSSAFVALTAPKAKVIYVVRDFVMSLNTNDATYGDSPDRWWCSGIMDHTQWSVAVPTQCNTGRLVATPGEIVAGLPLGDYAIAYKANSIHRGTYVGSPVVWQWDAIHNESGCVGQEALCDIDGAHFYVSDDGFNIFDGQGVIPIGKGTVSQWFSDNSSSTYRYKTICRYDRQNKRVFVFYVSRSASVLDQALVYHVTSKKWGKLTKSIEAALNYISAGMTIDGLTAVASTIDTLPSIPLDSQFWQSGGKSFSVFNTSHQIQSMTGECSASSITTGDVGDDEQYTLIQGARLRFLSNPDSSLGELFGKRDAGDDPAPRSVFTVVDGRADMLQSSRWHRLRFDFTGDYEVVGMRFNMVPEGTE